MSQKLPVNNFEWMEDNEDFIKNYNEESCEGHFLKVDLQYTEKLCFIMIYHFYLKN